MQRRNRWLVVIMFIVGSQLVACAGMPAKASTIAPATLEKIEGSQFKRVVLTEKAAERIGIKSTTVRAEQVSRTLKVGGRVMASPSAAGVAVAGAGPAAADLSKVWVRVRLTESDHSRIDRGHPARVLSLGSDGEDPEDEGLEAEADEGPDGDDGEDADETVYYSVDNQGLSLAPGQGVLVELPLAGPAAEYRVISYAAVVYGLQGETWVYTNPEQLRFIRQPIVVDYIEDGLAYLSQGPAVGTRVVTTGQAELLGVELGVGK